MTQVKWQLQDNQTVNKLSREVDLHVNGEMFATVDGTVTEVVNGQTFHFYVDSYAGNQKIGDGFGFFLHTKTEGIKEVEFDTYERYI